MLKVRQDRQRHRGDNLQQDVPCVDFGATRGSSGRRHNCTGPLLFTKQRRSQVVLDSLLRAQHILTLRLAFHYRLGSLPLGF